MQSLRLHSGQLIPAIGFGTSRVVPDSKATEMVLAALDAGYRLIDTAKMYGNEIGVGEALRRTKVPREEIFVTTKLWDSDHGHDKTLKAFDESLSKLGLDYLDLYLIHWPSTELRHESWQALIELYESGRSKSIGVSNYTIADLEELMEKSNRAPAVNQIEFNPNVYNRQAPILAFCKRYGIVVEAYSPLARGGLEGNKTLERIAKKYGKSPQQVTLRWCIHHGTVPLPRSVNPEHVRSNLDVDDFELSESDIDEINSISK